MTQSSYPSAPITEAVIEIKFTEPLSLDEIEKASEKFRDEYPQHHHIQTFAVNVQMPDGRAAEPTAKFDQEMGHRRGSIDMTELLLIWRSAFVTSQLAPYPGWESFFQRFVRDWRTWKRLVGFRQISRLGVRYINRIDIPVSGSIVQHEEYLNVYPKLPDALGNVGAYAVQAIMLIEEIGCRLTLNSAAIPSPILDHASFLFDQDIAKEIDPPQSDEAIFDLLNLIRVHKNRVFEECITDRARELFINGR